MSFKDMFLDQCDGVGSSFSSINAPAAPEKKGSESKPALGPLSLPGSSTPSYPPSKLSSPPLAKRRRTDSLSSVRQKGTLQRDVLLNEAMNALRESDEWSEHFAVSASIIRKAVTEFPDMERKFRREIMQFNLKVNTLFEEKQAQQMQVILIDEIYD